MSNVGRDSQCCVRLHPFSRFNCWDLPFFKCMMFSTAGGAHWTANQGSGEVFPINKPLIQTQPVQQDPPLFAYCILHIYYKFYTIWELLLSDDELKAPGTKLLFLFQSLGYQLRAGEVWSDKTVRRESFPFLFALGQMPFFWSQMGIRESNLGDFTPFSKGRGGFLPESSWSCWGRASILAENFFALII